MSMSRRVPILVFLGTFLPLVILSARGQDEEVPKVPDVRIAAPISTRQLLMATAGALKRDKGLQLAVSANLTSLDALDALAQGKADIAFLTRPLTGTDRAQYPDLELVAVPIGMEVIALGVSDDLWQAGVHTITQKGMRDIYELKTTNWKDLRGPDEKITLFSFEEGGGVWEVFAEWMYGDNRKAPLPKVENVANSQDARDALEFSPGSIAPIGASLVDGVRCHALGLDLGDHVVYPTPDAVAAGSYPMVRPIIAVVVGRPTLSIRVVTDFLTGPAGQALLKNSGSLGLDATPKPPVSDY
jgi:phosphate transport system substrate-binding protein